MKSAGEGKGKKEEKRRHTLARWPVPTIPTLPPAFSIVSLDIFLFNSDIPSRVW
jgi:hypothetical protein